METGKQVSRSRLVWPALIIISPVVWVPFGIGPEWISGSLAAISLLIGLSLMIVIYWDWRAANKPCRKPGCDGVLGIRRDIHVYYGREKLGGWISFYRCSRCGSWFERSYRTGGEIRRIYSREVFMAHIADGACDEGGIAQQVDSAEASTIAVRPSEPSGSPR